MNQKVLVLTNEVILGMTDDIFEIPCPFNRSYLLILSSITKMVETLRLKFTDLELLCTGSFPMAAIHC